METISAFDRRFPDDNACKYTWLHIAGRMVCIARAVIAKRRSTRSTLSLFTGVAGTLIAVDAAAINLAFITHSIFQDTKIGPTLWFKIAFLILTSKKGISALQVHRVIFGEDSGSDTGLAGSYACAGALR